MSATNRSLPPTNNMRMRPQTALTSSRRMRGNHPGLVAIAAILVVSMLAVDAWAQGRRSRQRDNRGTTTQQGGAAQLGGAGQAATQQGGQQNDDGLRQYRAAAALYDRQLYDLAIAEWKKFVEGFPNHARAAHGRHYLAISYFQTNDYGNAEAQFARLLGDKSDFELAEQATLYMGVSQLNLGRDGDNDKLRESLRTLQALRRTHADGEMAAEGLYYLGEAQYAVGDKDEAVKSYAALIKDHASHRLVPDGLYALGVTQEELNQSADAESSYELFLQHFSGHPLATEVSMRRGEALFQQEKYGEAEKLFQAAASVQGFDYADHAMVRQATCLARLEKYRDAATLYAEVPRRFANSEQLDFARLEGGKCYYLAGEFPSARRALESLAGSGGESGSEASHWVAQCYLKEDNAAEALKIVEAALRGRTGQHTVDLMLDRADALYAMNRRDDAMKAYADIAEDHEDHPAAEQAMYMAAFAAHEAGEFQDALGYASAYLRKHPRGALLVDVAYVAAESQLQLRLFDDAADSYQELIAAFPSHANVEDWKVRQALAVYAQDEPREAIDVLEPLAPSLKNTEKKAQAFYLLGASYNRVGESRKAVAALSSSLSASSSWRQADDARLELASALRATNDLTRARNQLQELIDGQTDNDKLARAHFLLGEIAYDARDYQTASGEYALVVNRWPDSPVAGGALYGLAWTQFSRQEFGDAEQTADRAIRAAEDDETRNRARYVRGLARKAQNNYDDAADDLEAFVSTATSDAERLDALYELGRCRVSQERFDDATQIFMSILDSDSNYSGADRVRYELAWSFKDAGNAEKAAEQFQSLADQSPNSPLAPEALHNLGEYHYDKQEYQQAALKYFAAEEKAKALATSGEITAARGKELGAKAVHKLGWSYFRKASPVWEQADQATDMDEAQSLFAKADEDFERAQSTFAYQLRAYANSPLTGDARFMQGECFFKQRKYAEAYGILSKVTDASNKQFVAFARLHAAQAANQLEEYADAITAIDISQDVFTEFDLAGEAQFERAYALHFQNQYDEAIAAYEQVTQATDREVAARACFMMGEAYFAKQDHNAAITAFFRAAYSYGYPKWQSASHFEAGRCFEQLNRRDDALKSYREVVNSFPQSAHAANAKARISALGGE